MIVLLWFYLAGFNRHAPTTTDRPSSACGRSPRDAQSFHPTGPALEAWPEFS